MGNGDRDVPSGLMASVGTALVVFVLIYLSAWVSIRQAIVIGGDSLRNNFNTASHR